MLKGGLDLADALQDLALGVCARGGALDLQAGPLQGSPALRGHGLRGEWWHGPVGKSLLGRGPLLRGRVHGGEARPGLGGEPGGALLIGGALRHGIIAIEDQIVSCGRDRAGGETRTAISTQNRGWVTR